METNTIVKVGKNGDIKFRGFRGRYHITYMDKSGKEQVVEYHLK